MRLRTVGSYKRNEPMRSLTPGSGTVSAGKLAPRLRSRLWKPSGAVSGVGELDVLRHRVLVTMSRSWAC